MKNIYKYMLVTILVASGCQNTKTYKRGINSSNGENTIVNSPNSSINKNGKEIWQRCKACHGEKGEKKALDKSAPIAGQDRETTIYQLKEYKNGNLNLYGFGQLMKGQASSLSDKDIEDVAKYIEELATLGG